MAAQPQRMAGGGGQPASAGGLRCKGWQQEAALRMLRYRAEVGRRDQAASDGHRGSESEAAIETALEQLGGEETLLIGERQPPRVISSSAESVRVCLEVKHAGEWLTTGGQDRVAFAARVVQAMAERHCDGSLAGKLVIGAGLGRAGGTLSLASTLRGGAYLGLEANPERIKQQVRAGVCDMFIYDLREAVRVLKQAIRRREPTSVALAAQPGAAMTEMVRRGIVPEVLIVAGEDDGRSGSVAAEQRAAMQAMIAAGAAAVTFGDDVSPDGGIATASDYTAASAAPPTRLLQWWALSGEASDLRASEEIFLGLVPVDAPEAAWIRSIRQRWRRNGMPARVAWLDLDLAQRFAAALQDWVLRGGARAPVLLGHVSLPGPKPAPVARPATEPPDADGRLTTENGAAIGVWSSYQGSPRWQQMAFVLDGSRSSRRRSEIWMQENWV